MLRNRLANRNDPGPETCHESICTIPLEELQGLADCKSRRYADYQVNMILDAADLQGLHVILTGDAAKKFPDALLDILANPAFAVLGAENQV